MKKQMILAALLCAAATAVRAETSYLYWMVDVSENENYAFSYATIKGINSDGTTSSFLSLYGSGQSDSSGNKLAATGWPTVNGTTTSALFAGVDGYGVGSKFLVELWASTGVDDADPTRVAWGTLAYSTVSGSIYTAMGQTDTAYTVTASQVVPEPTSGLLALLGLAALALRRKQTKV